LIEWVFIIGMALIAITAPIAAYMSTQKPKETEFIYNIPAEDTGTWTFNLEHIELSNSSLKLNDS